MDIIVDQNNSDEWDDFISANSEPVSFLQSFDWGEFNKIILGSQIERWTIKNKNKSVMKLQIIHKKLAGNYYFYYCPRGPVWQKGEGEEKFIAYKFILDKLRKSNDHVIFARVCPPYEYKNYLVGFIERLGLQKPKLLVHSKEPDKTLILDLLKSEDDLLLEMHHKTRYNIKLARKKGIIVREMTAMTKINDLAIFTKLSQATARRDKIKIYNEAYYRNLVDFFLENKKNIQLKMYLAEKDGQPLSAAIIIYFGKTATYLHGASANNYRELMPNYLLQWTMILDAKKRGMHYYDFWGVSEHRASWAGITRFKKGFGGREINFLGTWDFVLNKNKYLFFRLLKIIKKILFFK
jgi:lipid II:glycine glycyltransferase (peptidoglycan interpeptide bridge formation enzyme)